MNSVPAGSASASRSDSAQPSTFETNTTRGPPRVQGRNASTAIAGPRSEPPMPMLTTVRNGCPVALPHATIANRTRERQHALAFGEHLRLDVRAAERISRVLPQRHVQGRARSRWH